MNYDSLERHPNIVCMMGVAWEADSSSDIIWPVLVLELASPGSLDSYLAVEPSLSFDSLIRLCQDIAHGLEALHSCGIVHADLKCENILVFPGSGDSYDVAKLSDFGSSIICPPDESILM